MREKNRKVLVVLYILFILWMTLFSREPGTVRIVKGLFWEARMGYWWDIFLNILLFVPLGFLIGGKRAIVVGMLFSVGIELTQYVCKLGYCEIDDVLNNSIGVTVGVILVKVLMPFVLRVQKNIFKVF